MKVYRFTFESEESYNNTNPLVPRLFSTLDKAKEYAKSNTIMLFLDHEAAIYDSSTIANIVEEDGIFYYYNQDNDVFEKGIITESQVY